MNAQALCAWVEGVVMSGFSSWAGLELLAIAVFVCWVSGCLLYTSDAADE